MTAEQVEEEINNSLARAAFHLIEAAVSAAFAEATPEARARFNLLAQQTAETGELSDVQQEISRYACELAKFSFVRLKTALAEELAGPTEPIHS